MEKFPDHVDAPSMANGVASSPSPLKSSPYANGSATFPDQRLPTPRKENGGPSGRWAPAGRGHGRQMSLGDAFRHIRTRNTSVSDGAHEIADALRAPVSPKLIVRPTRTLFLL